MTTSKKEKSEITSEIVAHRLYNLDDYNKLHEKGYSNQEILQIWNRDIEHHTIANLLWLEANNPTALKEILAEYERLKTNNPYKSNP